MNGSGPESNQLSEGGQLRFVHDRHWLAWQIAFLLIGALIALAVFRLRGQLDGAVLIAVCVVTLVLVFILSAWNRFATSRVVTIDFENEQIVIEHYTYPVRFWDILPKRSVRIPFDDILSVQGLHGKGRSSYWVQTRESRFVVDDAVANYAELVRILKGLSTETPSAPVHRNQLVIGFGAVVVGLGIVALLGWMLGWI